MTAASERPAPDGCLRLSADALPGILLAALSANRPFRSF
jgi:hypothetical protein